MIIKIIIIIGKVLSSEDSCEGGLMRDSRTFQETPGPSSPEIQALLSCLSSWDVHRVDGAGTGALHLLSHGHSNLMVF